LLIDGRDRPRRPKDTKIMRPGYATGRPSLLLKSPNLREQAGRRWLAVVCAILGLALVSGLVGTLTRPASDLSNRPATGPFSYFPSQ
jgi:hypothetical protein